MKYIITKVKNAMNAFNSRYKISELKDRTMENIPSKIYRQILEKQAKYSRSTCEINPKCPIYVYVEIPE